VFVRKAIAVLAIGASAATFGLEVAACSSGSNTAAADAGVDLGPPAKPLCTDGGLQIAFNPMYSAYDSVHSFEIPAVVRGSNESVTWSADSTYVGMEVDPERPNEVLITMLRAGSVSINALSDDGKCASSILTITPTSTSDWEIGRARYNDGTSLKLNAAAQSGGGSPLEVSGVGGPACNNCHGISATTSVFTNVSHTPEQTGGFSDDDLLNIILRGQFPTGAYFDSNIVSYKAWQNFHRWGDITQDQEKGIIAYLRSLTPSPQKGEVNFNAFNFDSGSASSSGPDVSGQPDANVPDGTTTPEAEAGPDAIAPVEAGPVPDAVVE
jgi:hypothetical protein